MEIIKKVERIKRPSLRIKFTTLSLPSDSLISTARHKYVRYFTITHIMSNTDFQKFSPFY
jgi:hypothetical protein